MNLTIQYLIIYTAIALLRAYADWTGSNYEQWTSIEALEHATLTVNYAPQTAILFLACRMRVIWLTMGKGNPPIWMQYWMYAMTYSILLLTLIALVIPLFSGEKVPLNENGEPDEEHMPFKNTCAAICFTILKYLIMIGLYIGAIAIIYGTYNYEPPKGSWPGDKHPPISPAVECTMILTSLFFFA